jgi:Domain of unknown function (DUF5122) beta-propeller
VSAKLALTGGLLRVVTAAAVCDACILFAPCAPAAWGSYAGTLDPSFGHRGITVTEPTGFGDSFALAPSGRIVVGAYASAEPHNGKAPSTAVVARLLPNGALDPA